MKIHYDFEDLGNIRNAVVTTGSFDGVHTGHKAILERLKKLAFEIGGETVLITFHPHPRKVLYPDSFGKDLRLITTTREKTELLTRAGLDHLIIVNFTREFSRISSVDFVHDILIKKLHARKIITGYNHHFGHNREGDTEAMVKLGDRYGFDVEEIPEQEVQQESVSSVSIREALLSGNIGRANKYLGHNYIITGTCIRSGPGQAGNKLMNLSSSPRYTIIPEDETKLLPPDGSYPVLIIDEEGKYPGACIISNHMDPASPDSVTFQAKEPVHCLTGPITLLFLDFILQAYAY